MADIGEKIYLNSGSRLIKNVQRGYVAAGSVGTGKMNLNVGTFFTQGYNSSFVVYRDITISKVADINKCFTTIDTLIINDATDDNSNLVNYTCSLVNDTTLRIYFATNSNTNVAPSNLSMVRACWY